MAVSHTVSVLSVPPVAKRLPSGVNAMAVTAAIPALKLRVTRPVLGFAERNVALRVARRQNLPIGRVRNNLNRGGIALPVHHDTRSVGRFCRFLFCRFGRQRFGRVGGNVSSGKRGKCGAQSKAPCGAGNITNVIHANQNEILLRRASMKARRRNCVPLCPSGTNTAAAFLYGYSGKNRRREGQEAAIFRKSLFSYRRIARAA